MESLTPSVRLSSHDVTTIKSIGPSAWTIHMWYFVTHYCTSSETLQPSLQILTVCLAFWLKSGEWRWRWWWL